MKNIFNSRKEIINTFISILGVGLLIHLLYNYFHQEISNIITIFIELNDYIFIGSLLLVTYLIMNYRKQMNWKNIVSVIFLFTYVTSIFIWPIISSIIFSIFCTAIISIKDEIKSKETMLDKLYPSRDRLKKGLNEFINSNEYNFSNSLILIDGEWGIGKTYFIDNFFETYQNNTELIKIDVLLFRDKNAMIDYSLSELNKILKKNGDVSNNINKYINIIKDSSDSKLINGLLSLLIKNDSIQEIEEQIGKNIKNIKSQIFF